jgi:hypothetical protein
MHPLSISLMGSSLFTSMMRHLPTSEVATISESHGSCSLVFHWIIKFRLLRTLLLPRLADSLDGTRDPTRPVSLLDACCSHLTEFLGVLCFHRVLCWEEVVVLRRFPPIF